LAGQVLDEIKALTFEKPVLRLHVEIWTEKDSERGNLSRTCEALGFKRTPMRSYRRTIWMDLRPSEDDLFMGLSKHTRKNIRLPKRRGAEIRPIKESALEHRLDFLCRESCARTGGVYQPEDWGKWIRLSREKPFLCRFVGMFLAGDPGPESLIAHALGVHHGEVGEYAIAGSTRPANVSMPLHHAPLWDLILWSRRHGAKWFDFGGVTPGVEGDEGDPLGGIAEFKRTFCKNVVEVGREYVFTPSRRKDWVANVVHSVAERVRGGQ
jgi:lipid II:glycine glycyltransferase (peptidoglycan interpeptide bridge formation enzyme)